METKQTVYIVNGKVKEITYEPTSDLVKSELGVKMFVHTYKHGRKIYEDSKGKYIVDKTIYGQKRRLFDNREEVR